MLRTHPVGSLRAEHAEQTVTLTGWVSRRRDHGGVVFIDLRDASGIAQVVFRSGDAADAAHRLRAEFCVQVTGVVERRPAGSENACASRPERRGGERQRAGGAQRECAAALPARRAHRGRRGGAAALPLPGPAPRGSGRRDPAAQQGQPGGPGRAARARLRRGGDPDVDPLHPGGGARLPGARAAAAGQLLRAAAEPAAVQAAAHGRWAGALLPDRPLLPATRTSAPTANRSSPSSTWS